MEDSFKPWKRRTKLCDSGAYSSLANKNNGIPNVIVESPVNPKGTKGEEKNRHKGTRKVRRIKSSG